MVGISTEGSSGNVAEAPLAGYSGAQIWRDRLFTLTRGVKREMPVNNAQHVCPWKRYWCPRTARVDLSDNGYLSDPETEFGRLLNPELALFPEIDSNTAWYSLENQASARPRRCGSSSNDTKRLRPMMEISPRFH